MKPAARRPATLALEDGSVFGGFAFGAARDTFGEVVFNTSLSGYQEILTDPSYKGQMVAMTVSHVGNYGINPEDGESAGIHVDGFIVREACADPSNWRSRESLHAYLARHGVTGIEGVDTRALVILLRTKGALRGVIGTGKTSPTALVKRAKASPRIEDRDLVQEVSCGKPYEWTEPFADPVAPDPWTPPGHDALHAVVVDCGVKRNILRSLVSRGCRVTVVPAFTPAAGILALQPDGVVFSNGPGDPDRLPQMVQVVRDCIGKVPVFGICLGHQLVGKALGGRIFKLRFGHHGGNHPVRHERTGKVAITAQNHNFAVDPKNLVPEAEVTHLNLNDRTVEGLRHRTLPVFSVQYHPEAAPGPHDSRSLFKDFVTMMQGLRRSRSSGFRRNSDGLPQREAP
ncbi:MAG: glutamine-hydrolyzing carbamoyl-phosphate synthase small subunit [Candidatus Coatesbacteria bacterium]